MSLPWIRMWTEMPFDPKFRSVSRISAQPLPSVLAVFVVMLSDAAHNLSRDPERPGLTTISNEDIAAALDLEVDDVARIRQGMQQRNMLDGNRLTGWDRRQMNSGTRAAQRARAWRDARRARQKSSGEFPALHADTGVATPGLPEKPPAVAQASTQGAENASPTPGVGAPSPTRAAAKVRKTPIPPDFGISEAVRAWAKQKGFHRLEEHLEHFRDTSYAKSYQYADWDRAFMNAIRANWAHLPAGEGASSATPSRTPMPADFGVSEAVRAWAQKNGFVHLEKHLEHFRGRALANGYQYADWDTAFMNAVRENWARLPKTGGAEAGQSGFRERHKADLESFVLRVRETQDVRGAA